MLICVQSTFVASIFFKHTLRLYDKNCQSSIYSKTKKNSKSVVYSNTISFAKIDHFLAWKNLIQTSQNFS